MSFFFQYKSYPCKDIERAIRNLGFEFSSQKGSHKHWKMVRNQKMYKVTIDCHRGEVSAMNVKSIIGQAGVSKRIY